MLLSHPHHIGFPLNQFRTAEYDGSARFGRNMAVQLVPVRVGNHNFTSGLIRFVKKITKRTLFRFFIKSLRHAGTADCQNGSALNPAGAVIFFPVIERAVIILRRTVYHQFSAFYQEISIGIQSIALRIDMQHAAFDNQVRHRFHNLFGRLLFLLVLPAIGVNTVILGCNIEYAALYDDLIRLQSFFRLQSKTSRL